MKYYIIAGEASGDLHGSSLIASLKEKDPSASFRFYGGDLMASEAKGLVKHYRDTAIMGFVQVLLKMKTILRNLNECKQDILSFQPDCLILIDYPGFNLRIAKFIKTQTNIPIYYYIPPKLWAWKEGRIDQIKKYIDKVFVIFPFEVEFYAKHGCVAEYVGNPSVESVHHRKCRDVSRVNFLEQHQLEDKKIIALLAGSRKEEVRKSLNVMLALDQDKYPDCQFVLAATKAVDASVYEAYNTSQLKVLYDETYALLQHSHAALVNSGTATLETALFKVPQIVCYDMNFSWFIFPIMWTFFLKIPYISLVNIIAQKEVVKELVGKDFSQRNLEEALTHLLYDANYRGAQEVGYKNIATQLGSNIASDTTAEKIIKILRCS